MLSSFVLVARVLLYALKDGIGEWEDMKAVGNQVEEHIRKNRSHKLS